MCAFVGILFDAGLTPFDTPLFDALFNMPFDILFVLLPFDPFCDEVTARTTVGPGVGAPSDTNPSLVAGALVATASEADRTESVGATSADESEVTTDVGASIPATKVAVASGIAAVVASVVDRSMEGTMSAVIGASRARAAVIESTMGGRLEKTTSSIGPWHERELPLKMRPPPQMAEERSDALRRFHMSDIGLMPIINMNRCETHRSMSCRVEKEVPCKGECANLRALSNK